MTGLQSITFGPAGLWLSGLQEKSLEFDSRTSLLCVRVPPDTVFFLISPKQAQCVYILLFRKGLPWTGCRLEAQLMMGQMQP